MKKFVKYINHLGLFVLDYSGSFDIHFIAKNYKKTVFAVVFVKEKTLVLKEKYFEKFQYFMEILGKFFNRYPCENVTKYFCIFFVYGLVRNLCIFFYAFP